MRNLLGRLHARPPDDLPAIAAFWDSPLAGDRHAQVAALYRTLTDPRSVRDAWDRLGADERRLIRLLALGDAADRPPTLAEIAARLGLSEGEARETVNRLYRVGVLAVDGDDEPAQVGESPRLLLPRELALLFRRVQDEIEAGDVAGTPLRALLELLDDAEIEAAAEVWGIPIVPGLRDRADLSGQLLRRTADPERTTGVASRLRRDAARLWQRVRTAGRPVPLSQAAADAGLGGPPPNGQRLRRALAELERALLVWHGYGADGNRVLFVPAEILAPAAPAVPTLPPLPDLAEAVPDPPWRHPDALAWDLLTLLREVSDPSPAWPAAGAPPRARLRRLNERFWNRGDDAPPPGYVPFLCDLALAEGLLRRDGDDEATLVPAAAARRWRDLSFPAQTERLHRHWLDSPDWIEGRTRGEVEVWGADWRGARRKLAALLGTVDGGFAPGRWYARDALAARLAAREPELLGATFTAATARRGPETAAERDAGEGRAAATAEVIAVELETALAWFGLVAVADVPNRTRAVRLGPSDRAGAASAAAGADNAEPAELAGPALALTPNGDAEICRTTPLRVWALSAFADPVALGRPSVYRLSPASLERALAAGFDLEQVTTFLSRQTGGAVPAELAARLSAWTRGYRRVRVQDALVLTPDDPAALPALEHLARQAGAAPRPLDGTALLVTLPAAENDEARDALLRLAREAGFAPQEAKPPAPPHRPSTANGPSEPPPSRAGPPHR